MSDLSNQLAEIMLAGHMDRVPLAAGHCLYASGNCMSLKISLDNRDEWVTFEEGKGFVPIAKEGSYLDMNPDIVSR